MGHPTLCLVLHNHKKRKALQGQGRVALRSEDIDCKMTAEEFLEKWNNGESQKKLKNKLLLGAAGITYFPRFVSVSNETRDLIFRITKRHENILLFLFFKSITKYELSTLILLTFLYSFF